MRRRYSSRAARVSLPSGSVNLSSGRRKLAFDFPSLVSFYAVADVPRPLSVCQGDEAFEGAKRSDSAAWRFAWPAGVEKLADLPEFNIPRAKTARARRWSENDGDSMDMDRFRDGRAFMLQRYRPKTGARAGGRVQLVRVNIGENCGVEASAMLWKAYAVGRLVEQLEAAGVRVAVDVQYMTLDYDHCGNDYSCRISVKAPESPLNLSGLVAVCAPWFFRRWCLNHIAIQSNCSYGAGHATNLPAAPGSITIEKGECLSKAAAQTWLESVQRSAAALVAIEGGAL